MWWKSPAKKTTKSRRIADGAILDYSRVRVKPGMCRDYPRAVLVQVAPTLYLEDDRGLQMGVPSINSSCMRLANSSCPKTRTEPKPRILEVFSKRNNVLEKDLAPPAQPRFAGRQSKCRRPRPLGVPSINSSLHEIGELPTTGMLWSSSM